MTTTRSDTSTHSIQRRIGATVLVFDLTARHLTGVEGNWADYSIPMGVRQAHPHGKRILDWYTMGTSRRRMIPLRPTSMLSNFEDMPDPRVERLCSHKLIDIVMITICATIAGSDNWQEIVEFGEDREKWLRGFLDLPHGIPSHDTFQRVFAMMSPGEFEKRFRSWVSSVLPDSMSQVIAIDGKCLRGAHDRKSGEGLRYMVSAWATESRLVLGQTKVNEKSNEITAIPELLDLLDITDCVITIDAIGCQRKIAKQVIEQGADYVLAVKDNQPNLRQRMERVLGGSDQDKAPREVKYSSETSQDHGRLETRHCWVIQDADALRYVQKGEARWSGIQSLMKVQSECVIGDQVTGDCRYYISSLSLPPDRLLKIARQHWGIENSLHWCLDVAFREDESRYRHDHGPENLATVRHIAISLLKQDNTAKTGIRARRLRAARSIPYLERILGM